MHVQINCKDHGEVQATVNQNGDAFCFECYREHVQESLVVDESVVAPSPLLTEQERVVFRQNIMAGLGVSEAMMNGPTTYATSSISARMAEASKSEFLWFQCSQCGWGQRMAKAEAEVDGWEDGNACPHCGVGPIRSSPSGRFREEDA